MTEIETDAIAAKSTANGAQSLIRTLVNCGVDTCFSNPGTSEMHFVAALDEVPEMRGVLGLHEGVVTGAADGYGRMAGRPAATLLHLGPGLGNGLANLHNARRAHTPVINVVGDHATFHKRFDAPLESDIEAIAGAVSVWTGRADEPSSIGAIAAEAYAESMAAPGGVATLILPADASWGGGGEEASGADVLVSPTVPGETVERIAALFARGESTLLLIGGREVTRERGLRAASRIGAATGARLLVETFPARFERGAGLPSVERMGYLAEHVEAQLSGVEHLVLAGARSPVSFFAYPGRPGDLVPEGCEAHVFATHDEDVVGALEALAAIVAPDSEPVLQEPAVPALPSGELTVQNISDVIAATLPENVVIADEANTSGVLLPAATVGCPRHDVLTLTGGAIGQGLPVATGAAIACPDRHVLCLEADGSAMYSISALWTQAREGLDVTTVIFNNSAYAILRMELLRVGVETAGPQAQSLLDLSSPSLNFVSLSEGMGVPATRATTAEELAEQLEAAYREPGPHLIDAVIAPLF